MDSTMTRINGLAMEHLRGLAKATGLSQPGVLDVVLLAATPESVREMWVERSRRMEKEG